MIKVSRTKIKKIKVGELADAATEMANAVCTATATFTGTQPFTLAAVLLLVTAYSGAKSEFSLGGLLQKPLYLSTKTALVNCMLSFATYVDKIAVGNLVILDLSTLPTTQDLRDYLAEIIAGATAGGIKYIAGFTGQMMVDCIPFGPGVDYLFILSEGSLLPSGVIISATGQITIPSGCTTTISVCATKSRKKNIFGLTPLVMYYGYYALVYGETVGLLSAPVQMTCGN